MECTTIKLWKSHGEAVSINKPKKKALAELALAEQEERVPNLSEPDRQDAQVFLDFIAAGYKTEEPAEEIAEDPKPKKGKKTEEPAGAN